MEGNAAYVDLLVDALDRRMKWLGAVVVPQLKEALASYQAQFENTVAMLIRKGLLREDPYNYDQAFTDITVPADEILPEFESSDELSYRLAAFRRQLKLISTEFDLDLGSLTLARLKKLSALVFYVNWLEFGEAARSPTTKAFARLFMKVRVGSDNIASQILKDGEIQTVKLMHQLRGILADLIAYNRESWKAEVRRTVLPRLPAGETPRKRDELLHAMRRVYGQTMASKPWYPALAEEIADEETAANAAERKKKILDSLTIPEAEVAPAAVAEQDGRETLLEAVRLLSRPHEEITTALAVLEENEKLLTEQKSRGGLLRILFGGGGGSRKPPERIYRVQYLEPGSPDPRTEPVDFPAFLLESAKKASMLGVLSAGSGPAYRRLEATGDAQLAGFVDRQLNDLLLIHRRMESLNAVFQARAAQEKKTARGIKVELLTIKNSIVKANQRRHEYRDGAAD
jgi:hypothetical protein